jgi:phytanoyl-CoA hydroxylase
MLAPAQVEQFKAQGFLSSSKVLSGRKVDVLRRELERVMRETANPEVPQPISIRNLNGSSATPVWQIVNIWEASEPFQRLISHPKIVEEVAQLSGAKELRLWHDQIQFKPASLGGVNHWHQDWPYWPSIAPWNEQVSAWIALDDVDEKNGCMSMVPGSHLWGNCIEFLQGLPDFTAMPERYEGHEIEVRRVPVKKGEVHYHHSLTWHGSHENHSGRPRRAIACHYMTEKTCFVASGNHMMKRFVEVADGQKLEGEHFPLVWAESRDQFSARDGAGSAARRSGSGAGPSPFSGDTGATTAPAGTSLPRS